MSGGADNVPKGTVVRGTRYLGGHAPSNTLLSSIRVVTQVMLPSILPPEGGISAHFL